MKIALLATNRGRGSGGTRKYLQHMAPLLREQAGVDDVYVFAPPELAGPGDHIWPAGDDLLGFRSLRRELLSLRVDVMLNPTARVFRVDGISLVTMVQNMEPLEVPFGGNSMVDSLKNILRARSIRNACRISDRVIAVSNHVRNVLVERLHVPAERVATIYTGIDKAPAEDPPEPQALLHLSGRRFLFTAGSIRPARGIEDLVIAMSSLPEDVHLLIAGSPDPGSEHYKAKMERLAERRGVSSRIIWLGHVDAATMSWCYRRAAVFVVTSRAEACPNVVLEGLAEGALSVSTTKSPMPEFFADAAIYYRERDAEDLGARIREALAAPEQTRQRLRAAARARATLYSWDATVRATVVELERARGGQ